MRVALKAALGAAILMSGTTMASAGGGRAHEACILDLMRHHVRAEAPAKAAPKKVAVKKAAPKKVAAKPAAKKPLK